MRKIAMIRKNDEEKCPFGLPIPFGCGNAGCCIDRMSPIDIMGADSSDEEKEEISDANVKLLGMELARTSEKPSKCKYAAAIMEGKKAVECNYDDTAPGEGPNNLLGSPYYTTVFQGVGSSGLYTYPVGYYADYNSSRNLFFGQYSLQGMKKEELIKSAVKNMLLKSNKYKKETNG